MLSHPSLTVLKSISIFENLTDDHLSEIRANSVCKTIDPGFHLMEQNEECFFVYILLRGEVVYTYTEVQKPLYLLNSKKHDLIGSVPTVIGGVPPTGKRLCPCDAFSLTQCELIRIESATLRKIYETSDPFARNMGFYHAQKLQRVLETLVPLAQAGVMGRLLSCLHSLFLKDGKPSPGAGGIGGCLPRTINRYVSNRELAERVGSSPTGISKAMQKLFRAKLVKRTRASLVTPDVNRLYEALVKFSRMGKLL